VSPRKAAALCAAGWALGLAVVAVEVRTRYRQGVGLVDKGLDAVVEALVDIRG
jgi:hypothetical protein